MSSTSIALKGILAEALLFPSLLNAQNYLPITPSRSHRSRANDYKWQHRSSFSRSLFDGHLRSLHFLVLDSEESGELEVQAHRKYWTLPRLYVGPREDVLRNSSLKSGALIHLSSDQAHYLTNVMRILKKRTNSGADDSAEEIRIFNGKSGEWLAKVHVSEEQHNASSRGKGRSGRRNRSPKCNRDVTLVAQCILQLRPQDEDDSSRPWVFFAPIRSQSRMKIMIEKCTELGVGRFVPVASDRIVDGALMALLGSNTNVDEANVDDGYGGGYNGCRGKDQQIPLFGKLEAQAIEAAEQCERLRIPIITNDTSLTRPAGKSQDSLWKVQDLVKLWCDRWEQSGNCLSADGDSTEERRILLICRERASGIDINDSSASIVPVLQALDDNRRVSFLVGPEGGWSEEENEMFDEICSKYSGMEHSPIQCVSLGSSVLRAETASMMAVGAWLINDSRRM